MKKIIFAAIVSMLFINGCDSCNQEKPAIKIGSIPITSQEFYEAFSESSFALGGDEAKKEYLEQFIARKLMLKEAENMGLNKEKNFLRDLQFFWEQSLLKSVISAKTKELSMSINVPDKEIEGYYTLHKDAFNDRDLPKVYDQIKWLILKEKQQKAVNDWISALRSKTDIDINYELLGIKK